MTLRCLLKPWRFNQDLTVKATKEDWHTGVSYPAQETSSVPGNV